MDRGHSLRSTRSAVYPPYSRLMVILNISWPLWCKNGNLTFWFTFKAQIQFVFSSGRTGSFPSDPRAVISLTGLTFVPECLPDGMMRALLRQVKQTGRLHRKPIALAAVSIRSAEVAGGYRVLSGFVRSAADCTRTESGASCTGLIS